MIEKLLDSLKNVDLNNIEGMKKPNDNMWVPNNVGNPPAMNADTENSKYFDL